MAAIPLLEDFLRKIANNYYLRDTVKSNKK